MKYLSHISLATFLLGMCIYAYHHSWIIVRNPFAQFITPPNNLHAHKKQIKLWYYQDMQGVAETHQLLWEENNNASNAAQVCHAFFGLVYEENICAIKIQLLSVALSPSGTELYLNFSQCPFDQESSIEKKWLFIEGLLRTLRENIPTIKYAHFLINHKPFTDHHLDFCRPWPIEGFITTQNSAHAATAYIPTQHMPFTLMLEPAGDAQYTGRIIEDTFERGLTLQCAQEIKKELDKLCPHVRVILSRFPGEVLEPLQNAAFANRLQTDIYITLSMYELPASAQYADPLPEITLYYFLYHPVTDFWQRSRAQLNCEPYHHAHMLSCSKSQQYAENLYKNLSAIKPFGAKLNYYAGVPLKALIGIRAPAILIEIGLPHKQDWHTVSLQLAQQICNIL